MRAFVAITVVLVLSVSALAAPLVVRANPTMVSKGPGGPEAPPPAPRAPSGLASASVMGSDAQRTSPDGLVEKSFTLAIADPRAPLEAPQAQNCIVVTVNASKTQLLDGYVQV